MLEGKKLMSDRNVLFDRGVPLPHQECSGSKEVQQIVRLGGCLCHHLCQIQVRSDMTYHLPTARVLPSKTFTSPSNNRFLGYALVKRIRYGR